MKWKWRGAGGPLASAPTLSWHRNDEHPGFIPSDNRGRGGGGRKQTPRRKAEMKKNSDKKERKSERQTPRPKTATSLPPSSFIHASLSSCPELFFSSFFDVMVLFAGH